MRCADCSAVLHQQMEKAIGDGALAVVWADDLGAWTCRVTGDEHRAVESKPEPEEDRRMDLCLNAGPDCAGAVEYRMPLSGTGRSFPRCDQHWAERLDVQEALAERYPEQPPADWSPLDAGESWDEAD